MTNLRALQALANDRRLQILEWLKDPEAHFRSAGRWGLGQGRGVRCFDRGEAWVSQPTLSEHMRILSEAELVQGKRIKQWIFYRRDERRIREIKKAIASEL